MYMNDDIIIENVPNNFPFVTCRIQVNEGNNLKFKCKNQRACVRLSGMLTVRFQIQIFMYFFRKK